MKDSSPSTKKRKANDGRATVSHHDGGGGGGLFSSWLSYFSGRSGDGTSPTAQSTCGGENLTQKLDAMMQMMSRMEEKLTTVSSLERRCENLEAECSSLKTMLGSLKDHVDSKFDKQNEYNNMLVRNQSWKYSPPVRSFEHWEADGYDGDTAEYLAEGSEGLKRMSEKMRRGGFPSEYSDGRKGIDLHWAEEDPILDHDATLGIRLHWIEFAKALEQFTPAFGVLPDGSETYFTLENIQLAGDVPVLLKNALMNKPFQQLKFVNKADARHNEGMTINSIMDIVESNKHLRDLSIGNNRIELGHMEKICSAVCHRSIVKLDLYNCFENGLGDDMIRSLLTSGGLAKLERLGIATNGLDSSTITALANFVATNPPLQELDIDDNVLGDNDAQALANALRSNTTLRILGLHSNAISAAGKELFHLVVHGDGNLNSIADSNHSCSVVGLKINCWNAYKFWKNGAWQLTPRCERSRNNRARKIYRLLSKRNKSMSTSNVQYFDGIDVKLLPFMLKAVQTYASVVPHAHDRHRSGYYRVKPLSIVYEVMRKWDKVFPLYTDGGDNDNGSIE